MALRLRPRSIQGELAQILGVVLLPLIGLTAYFLYAQAQHDVADAEANVRRLAATYAERAERFVADARALLQTVALRPQVRAVGPASCDPGLRELLELYPLADDFLVADRQGRIQCGARSPARPGAARIDDEALLRDALAAGGLTLSPPVAGRTGDRRYVAAVQPVIGQDGALAGAVGMLVDLAKWDPFPFGSGQPEGTVAVLLRDGVVIAGAGEASAWIGRDLSGSEVMARVRNGARDLVQASETADVDRLWVNARIAGTRWTVLAGMPADKVIGPVRERAMQVGGLVSLVVALVVAMAVAFARRLAHSTGTIAQAHSRQLFAALSELNEAVVRATERDALFRQVCRICVDRIQFLAASVALIDPAQQRIVPRVHAGPGSDVLGDLTFPRGPSDPLSATVTSTAVRTKRAAVANDVDADPAMGAARPICERIGSKSAASFPLFHGGGVIGALTVHAASRDFFDGAVVELLTRMAGDISFALDRLAERGELEERVRQRTAALDAANEELEAFSYSVSHDLRAPLRHIDGFVRLLEEALAPPSAKVGHYLATIAAAARRMGTLIDDLLTLSRTGRQAIELRRVDLGALVGDLVRDAGSESANRGVQWTVGELPVVMADASLLRIVLHNLLSNALKYSRPQPVARIAVEARAGERGTVEVTVRDNGVGFDERFKDKLFGAFQRLHREDEFEGTGMGLATARRIVHRHGHRIWGRSELGKGAAFTFTMTQAEMAHGSNAHTAG